MKACLVLALVLVPLVAASREFSGFKNSGVAGAREKVQAYWHSWNDAIAAGDEDAFRSLYTDNARLDGGGMEPIVGTDSEGFADAIKGLFKVNRSMDFDTTDLIQLARKYKPAGANGGIHEWFVLAASAVATPQNAEGGSGNALTLFQWVPTGPAAEPTFWSSLTNFLPFKLQNHPPAEGVMKARWAMWNSGKEGPKVSEPLPSPKLADPPLQMVLERLVTSRWQRFHEAVVAKDEKALGQFFTRDAVVLPPNGGEAVRGGGNVARMLLEHMGEHSPSEAPERTFNELMLMTGHKKIKSALEGVKVKHFILEESAFTLGTKHAGKQIVLWDAVKHGKYAEEELEIDALNEMSWKKFDLRMSMFAMNFNGNDESSPTPTPEVEGFVATQ